MEQRQRWPAKNRRMGADRRMFNDPDYMGPERRSGHDRRTGGRAALLLVDSSPTFLFYMGMLLKKLDYQVRTATTAEDALALMRDFTPALVITDTTLPKMSGVVLLKQMRQSPQLQSIPVLFHTADHNPAVQAACDHEGCAGFFIKPVEPEPLYRAIQAATETVPRQMIRIDTILPLEVANRTVPGAAARKETITTLSEGGCYIKTLIPEPVNAVVFLKIFIQNKEIKTAAMVLTSSAKIAGEHKEPGMSVKFLDITPSDKAMLRDFIKAHILQDLSVPEKSASGKRVP